MAHDLIFFEKRSTPKVVTAGASFKAQASYGKQTRRRRATPEEEKQIARGDWLRVDQSGNKGGQPGYKKTRMKGRKHLLKHSDMSDGYSAVLISAQEFETPEQALRHYGVKGMKWGVRKDGKSGSTEAGLSPDEQQAVAIVSLVALYAARQGQKHYMDSGIRDAKKTNREAKKQDGDFDWKKNENLSGKKTVDEIMRDVVPQINPGFGAKGTQMNCRRCTFTYEQRRRGNDVTATKSKYATGQDFKGVVRATTKKGDPKNKYEMSVPMWGRDEIAGYSAMSRMTSSQKSQSIFDHIGKQPDGARGELAVSWLFGGGHSMAWEVVNGSPVIFDGQSGVTYTSPSSFDRFSSVTTSAYSTRLDNQHMNNDFLKRWMVNNAD